MAILAECPLCRKKQKLKNKLCSCGTDLDKAKRNGVVKYHIVYRLPIGKQRKELIGTSIEEARDAEGKRRGQKRENKIWEILPESKMTFEHLSEWYLDQESVKDLASYYIIEMKLKQFNKEFGEWKVSDIRQADLKNYQVKLKKKKLAPATVDQSIRKVKTMINMAFENDMVSGATLKAFKRIKPTLKKGSDVRDRILSLDEFESLMKHAEGHTRGIIAMGYYTGMRKGEILNLTWNKIKLDKRLIQLDPEDTKDKEARDIPICDELYQILLELPTRLQSTGKDNHVFQFKGKSVDDIRKGIKKACKGAGIEYGRFTKGGFIFHDLRHTFNTNMRKAGVSESVIMAITGHSTREMFDRYNTVDDQDKRKAIDQLENFFENVAQTLPKDEKKPLEENNESL